jgi:predicted ATPase
MLIEFRVENYRSLREEQAISFFPEPRIDPDDPILRKVAGVESAVLPAIAIYGANASGKSNVLAALTFMRDAVLHSHRFWNPEGGVPRSPFAWNGLPALPSLFEVRFATGGTRFDYGFTVSDSAIEEEWLFSDNKVVFQREKLEYRYRKSFEGQRKQIESLTRPNALFLSTAVQFGSESLLPIFRFFSAMVPCEKLARSRTSFSSRSMFRSDASEWSFPALFPSFESDQPRSPSDDADFICQARDLLRAADLGFVDIRKDVSEKTFATGRTIKEEQYAFQHEQGNDDSWLPLEEESEGTQRLFRIAQRLIRLLAVGGILLVDGIETSLHPRLASKIVEMFNCPKINRRNAQLIFTSHDTNLLGNTIGEPALRRDQVWFVEKDETGSTKLYPLTSFHPRKEENLERGYLQGRYGAVPYVDNLFAGDSAVTKVSGRKRASQTARSSRRG